MHICIISPDYPTSRTIDFVFVEQLCQVLARRGQTVTVIAPQSVTKCLIRHIPIAKGKQFVYIGDNEGYTLIRPKYISVGKLKGCLKHHNTNAFKKAVMNAFKQVDGHIDVAYGHFWQSVSAAYTITKKMGIPLFASSGEEIVTKRRIGFSSEGICRIRQYIYGSIHVSTNNRNECLAVGLTSEDISVVIPNAINNSLFYPYEKQTARKKLHLANDSFIVIFVGQFTNRKGVLRLNAALKQLNDKNIEAIFIGQGVDNPDYDRIVIKGRQPHDHLPLLLSASDVFVLPTLHEGCCNAVIEALACGLPVISSDRPFNHDILNETNSILVEPDDITAIATAIKFLKDNPQQRTRLSRGALKMAEGLTLDQRVDKILSFINNSITRSKY